MNILMKNFSITALFCASALFLPVYASTVKKENVPAPAKVPAVKKLAKAKKILYNI